MTKASILFAALLIAACSESEDSHSSDECSSGRVWSEAEGECVNAPADHESSGGAGGTSESDDDAGDDDSDDDTSKAGGGQGGSGQGGDGNTAQAGSTSTDSNFHAECEATDECADGDAPYCLVNPATGAGECVPVDCEPGGCADSYLCCDCSEAAGVSSTFVDPTCFPPPGAESMTGLGCSCE